MTRTRDRHALECSLGAMALLVLAAPVPAASADWWVRCDPGAGTVEAVETPRGTAGLVMADGFPGPATARAWIEEHCSSARCDGGGQCVAGAPAAAPTPPARASEASDTGADDWEAGAVVDLGSARKGSAPARPFAPTSASPTGPSPANLDLFVATARAAADACRYDAALAAGDQMAEFDPAHPFLASNRERLGELARRQKRTETAVWRAAQLLEQQKLADARKIAREAAAAALSCQTVAVSQLAAGIEEADARLRAERSVANRRAAAALLAPLMSLANALQGEGTVGGASVPGGGAATPGGGAAAPVLDRCAFDYSYPSKWSTEPVCRCARWSFDARQFRCVAARP